MGIVPSSWAFAHAFRLLTSLETDLRGAEFLLPLILKVCAKSSVSEGRRQLHAQVSKNPLFLRDPFVAVLCIYLDLDQVKAAALCFDRMPVRDIITYASMIGGFMKCGWLQSAREVFDEITEKASVYGTEQTHVSLSDSYLFYERMLLFCEPYPHTEWPDRLRAIASSFAAAGIFPGKCSLISAREIKKEELQLVHTSDHVEAVQQMSNMLYSYFTSYTYSNEHSACAPRFAAGLCADLACTIMSRSIKNGVVLVRPPGHHVGIKHAMSFLFSQCCCCINSSVQLLRSSLMTTKKLMQHGQCTF